MDVVDTGSGIENVTSGEESQALRRRGRLGTGSGRTGLCIGSRRTARTSHAKRLSAFCCTPKLKVLIAALGRKNSGGQRRQLCETHSGREPAVNLIVLLVCCGAICGVSVLVLVLILSDRTLSGEKRFSLELERVFMDGNGSRLRTRKVDEWRITLRVGPNVVQHTTPLFLNV